MFFGPPGAPWACFICQSALSKCFYRNKNQKGSDGTGEGNRRTANLATTFDERAFGLREPAEFLEEFLLLGSQALRHLQMDLLGQRRRERKAIRLNSASTAVTAKPQSSISYQNNNFSLF